MDGTLDLPDERDVPFHTIWPEDVDALQRFHERLGERAIYLRFFGSMKELSERKAKYFAYVDRVDHVAFVALDPDNPDKIVTVVRYDRERSEDEEAEYAAIVEDRWQDHGIGIALTPRADRRSQRQRGSVFLCARDGREQAKAGAPAASGPSRARTPR